MPARIRTRLVPLSLSALVVVLAVLQRPGWSSSDTKIHLHTEPVRFLADIASLWTPSSGLGGVESAQYAGYLFPMGPFFALGHWLGVSDWLVDRLWLGLLLAIGCWGMVRAAEQIGGVQTRAGAAAAGLVYLLNPYVVVFTNRTTITLLAYALMPWLVLVARRGLREPRRWAAPALFALIFTSSGGGVNAAVVALVLVAPLALVAYEVLLGDAPWRSAWQFGWRTVLAMVLASLWWIAPTAAQAVYGVDFLRFTEPPGAIWATTSLSETFRAMGYWITYIGVGFNGVVRPSFTDAGTMLFDGLVVTASFLVPGAALAGFAWTRRLRHASYFLGLVLLGTLLMTLGFPEGTPLRRGATFAYNHVDSVRFLRTTYKAGPLVVFGTAGLIGLAAEHLAGRLRGVRMAAVAVAGCAVLALAAWPVTTGRAVDGQVSWKRIPAGWSAAAADLDKTLGPDARAAVLPGQLYAFYRWGGTVDPILPALTTRPVAVRNAVPYADLRGTDLLWTTDALLQQKRLLPGQLQPLLRLMSVRNVVNALDDDPFRSGAVDPAASPAQLRGQGLTRRRSYGDGVSSYGVAKPLPLVRMERRGPLTVVDGGATGLAALAGLGALPERVAFSYAADLDARSIRAAALAGGEVVVSDSNRRRVFVISRMQQNSGWTLAADEQPSADAAMLDLFPARGSDAQTVAVLRGVRSIRAPFSPGFPQYPEHRPYAAFDGNPRTVWLPDPALNRARHELTVTFNAPRDVRAIDVLPRGDAGAKPTAVVVNGRRFAAGAGWKHIELGLEKVGALTIRVETTNGSAAAAGLAEVRVPGLKVTESLRPPVVAERALEGIDLSHATLRYVFSRVSGDNPLERTSSFGARIRRRVNDANELETLRVAGAGDEEVGLDREISPPAARTYDAKAWLSVTPEASDTAIDRLVGARGNLEVDSSGRWRGKPGARGSSAFDGDRSTAWVAPAAGAWLRVRSSKEVRPRTLVLEAPSGEGGAPRAAAPSVVRVSWPGGRSGPLPVRGGRVDLPPGLRTRALTISVLATRPVRAAAVAISEVRAIGQVGPRGLGPLAGLGPLRVPRAGAIRGCSALTVRGTGLRVSSDIADLDAGRPLAAQSCGRIALPEGNQRLVVAPRTLRPDQLLLTAPVPAPIARSSSTPGVVRNPGRPGRGRRDAVKLDVRVPAWLVLGESYDKGWRAWCDGRALGQPVPLDGYANAWPIEPGCKAARFEFAPQKPVHVLQLLSVLACLLLLLTALAGARSSRLGAAERAGPSGAFDGAADGAGPQRTTALRAVSLGLAVGAALAFSFSLRSGLLIAPATALVLWRGVPAMPLALAGGLLLGIAVPVDYILFPADDLGGYAPDYAGDHISGHWIAVAAWVLLFLALWRTLSTARRRRGGPSATPAGARG